MTQPWPDERDHCEVSGGRGDAADASLLEGYRSRLHFGRGRRLPMIRQTEAAECGLACLAMVAGYHGHHVELSALRQRHAVSLKGVTLARLIDIAQALGFSVRPVRLELDELVHLLVPCILHWDLNHFVVLREVRRDRVVVHDPAVGERLLKLEEVDKHLTGVAMELSRGPSFQRKRPEPPVSLRTLAGSIEGLGRSLLQVFILALVLELFALVAPQFLQIIVDQVLADSDRDLLTLLGISFLLLLLLQVAVSTLRTWVVLWLGTHFNLSWTGNVFQHLLKLPQSYFLKRHLGDIVSRFGAISTIQQTLTTQFVGVILDGLMAALTLAMLFFYSIPMAMLTVAAVLIYLVLRLVYFQIYREANLNQIVGTAKQQSGFMEAIRGVQTLQLYNQEGRQTARYLNATADVLNKSIAVQKLNMGFVALSSLTGGVQRIAVLWLGAWLALKGQFSAGMLMAFAAYAEQFMARAGSLIDYLIQLRLLRLQGERLADIVLTAPEQLADGVYVGPEPEPSIRLEKVSFRYAEGEPWVLRNCSFEIKAGESVAIVGPSGCGKSTLVRLLLGLLDPQEGTISVGGVNLRHLGKRNYRHMVASVMQEDRLFSGSIADNISFFDEAATFEQVEQAARSAQLHEDIVAMPMGYHSLVGDMGSSLSGGQKQRLFIARAMYAKPRILVLDEATSHLDGERETHINRLLSSLSMTRVIIAHRQETIASADRIIDLAKLNQEGSGDTDIPLGSR